MNPLGNYRTTYHDILGDALFCHQLDCVFRLLALGEKVTTLVSNKDNGTRDENSRAVAGAVT